MVSFKVIARLEYVNKKGLAPLYLQFFIEGKRLRLPLKMSVPAKLWSVEKQCVKGNNAYVNNLNLLIETERSRMNKIMVDARLTGTEISIEFLTREYTRSELRYDFLKFMERDIKTRKGLISNNSIRHHYVVLQKLKDLTGGKLRFNELSFDLIEKFEKYLLKKGNGSNTVWSNLRIFKSYINRGKKKGIRIENPFDNYKIFQVQGNRTFLTKDEFKKLAVLYEREWLPQNLKNALQYFLFACCTGGIRYGDIVTLKRNNIINDTLVFIPSKTKKQNKQVSIPLSEINYRYLNHDTPELFNRVYSDVKTNEYIRDAIRLCGIQKKITFHSSRHTFATLFLTAGGSVVLLKDILRHSKLETTMIYEHMSKDVLLKEKQLTAMADYIDR